MKKHLNSFLICAFVLVANPANAEVFWKTGEITRTLTDIAYGGCMIHISTAIGNGCPNNGWVSLDCVDAFYPRGTGTRAYASALTALSLGRNVSVLIDNTKKHNTYCVARSLHIR